MNSRKPSRLRNAANASATASTKRDALAAELERGMLLSLRLPLRL